MSHQLGQMLSCSTPNDPDKWPRATLTDKEMQIITMLAEGKTRKEIAPALFISFDTVDKAIRRLHIKFKVFNTTHMIAVCYQNGVLKHTENSRCQTG